MTTATDTITITLIQAVCGLVAEVDGLPVQVGPEYVRQARNSELAAAALRERYPELVVRSATIQSETSVLLLLEQV